MTNLLTTLETIAQDASLQTKDALEAFVNQTELTQQEKTALIIQDSNAIANKLGVKTDIVCMVVPAKDDEPEDQDNEEDKEETSSKSLRVANI